MSVIRWDSLYYRGRHKHVSSNRMREPGLEPGSLATPDPKSHPTPKPTALESGSLVPGDTEIPPDSTPGTTQNATCGSRRGFCECEREKGHGGMHVCGDCADQYETDTGDYCDSCGKLCYGEKGTAEEPIRQDDGSIKCGECFEEDSAE